MILRILLSPVAMFFYAALIILHQYMFWGIWWEWNEIHHEAFVIMFLFAGFLLLIIKKSPI